MYSAEVANQTNDKVSEKGEWGVNGKSLKVDNRA